MCVLVEQEVAPLIRAGLVGFQRLDAVYGGGASARGPQQSGRLQVLEPSAAGTGAPEGAEQADRLVRQCVAAAEQVAARGVLLRVTFETLFEYLAVSVCGAAKLPHAFKETCVSACKEHSACCVKSVCLL